MIITPNDEVLNFSEDHTLISSPPNTPLFNTIRMVDKCI
jgi:hypothetical protein